MKHRYPLVLSLLVAATSAKATVTDFDNLAVGTIVTNHYAGATISSNGGQDNWTEAQNLGSSQPNFICTLDTAGNINCTNQTYIDFSGGGVNGLTFYAIGVNNVGSIAVLDIFTNNICNTTISVM